MKCKNQLTESLLVAAIMVTAGLFVQAHVANAQETAQEGEPEGRIVQIGPTDNQQADLPAVREEAAPEEVGYWIGISGRNIESDILRTQLQLAEDSGVVIEEVVPDSPAEKSGLRKHDIILRANGDMVDSMTVLQDLVSKGKDKPIDLKILRLGKETAVSVTPAERPADFHQLSQQQGQGFDPFRDQGNALRQLFQFNGGAGLPGGFRVFGPGMVFNNRMDFGKLPNGVSVSITRENDGPAQITVRKGEQTWSLSSDDAEALQKLPEDVRQYVEGLMSGGIDIRKELGNFDWQAELQHMLPNNLGQMPNMQGFQQQENRVMKRMEELEKRIEQLQEQVEEDK